MESSDIEQTNTEIKKVTDAMEALEVAESEDIIFIYTFNGKKYTRCIQKKLLVKKSEYFKAVLSHNWKQETVYDLTETIQNPHVFFILIGCLGHSYDSYQLLLRYIRYYDSVLTDPDLRNQQEDTHNMYIKYCCSKYNWRIEDALLHTNKDRDNNESYKLRYDGNYTDLSRICVELYHLYDYYQISDNDIVIIEKERSALYKYLMNDHFITFKKFIEQVPDEMFFSQVLYVSSIIEEDDIEKYFTQIFAHYIRKACHDVELDPYRIYLKTEISIRNNRIEHECTLSVKYMTMIMNL